MPEAHLTTGDVVYDKGFEYYTFGIGPHGIRALSASNDPHHTLVSWYMANPRPAKSEVVGIDITPNEAENLVMIDMKIQRGHYFMSYFLVKHSKHDIRIIHTKDEIEIHCDTCQKSIVLYKESVATHTHMFSQT